MEVGVGGWGGGGKNNTEELLLGENPKPGKERH